MTKGLFTDKLFQVTLNIGVSYSQDEKKYKEVYEALDNLGHIQGKSLRSSVHIKRDEYNPDTHIAFLTSDEDLAKSIVRKAKDSGLVRETYIDQI